MNVYMSSHSSIDSPRAIHDPTQGLDQQVVAALGEEEGYQERCAMLHVESLRVE
jgi:hypothetical protein